MGQSATKSSLYSAEQASHILAAHRSLFPAVEGALRKYWDHDRQRPWSFLTTDFHRVSVEQVMAFHQEVHGFGLPKLPPGVIGERLREMSARHGVGYSLGISPWTDGLLLQTFRRDVRSVVIVLGHDWYPVGATMKGSALTSYSPVQKDLVWDYPRYGTAFPERLRVAQEFCVLFLNFYPDFRPPGDAKEGSLSYGHCMDGFNAICESLAEAYEILGVISWGSPVWKVLRARVGDEWRSVGIMAAGEELRDMRLQLSNGQTVPYFPIAHPCRSSNFNSHLRTLSGALDRIARAAAA